MKQGHSTVVDYSTEFHVLAADRWNKLALWVVFLQELHPDLQTELACHDAGMNLDQVIALRIQLDHYLRAKLRWTTPLRLPPVKSNLHSDGHTLKLEEEPVTEPMQLGSSSLMPQNERGEETAASIAVAEDTGCQIAPKKWNVGLEGKTDNLLVTISSVQFYLLSLSPPF